MRDALMNLEGVGHLAKLLNAQQLTSASLLFISATQLAGVGRSTFVTSRFFTIKVRSRLRFSSATSFNSISMVVKDLYCSVILTAIK